MALKTNTKQARKNIQQYIINHNGLDNGDTRRGEFPEIATAIYNRFIKEAFATENEKRYYNGYEFAAFEGWCWGLCGALKSANFLLQNGVDVLGDILEESQAERSKYTEEQAEQKIIYLFYREIKKAVQEQ